MREKNELAWIIHEPSLLQMRGVDPCCCTRVPQMDRNEADVVKSARPKGKKRRCRFSQP